MTEFDISYTYSDFLLLISFYSALRYILSYVLTGEEKIKLFSNLPLRGQGNFSVNYLLGKYYCKFLKALKNSRYRQFLQLFVEPPCPQSGRLNKVQSTTVFYFTNSKFRKCPYISRFFCICKLLYLR